jgi:hypothetical protein
MIGKNIRFSVSKFHIVEQLRYSMGSGFLLISAGTGALMSERNSRKSVATAARPTSRRFWFVGLFIVAICTGLAVWQLWHTLFAPRADSTATDSGQSGQAAHREGVEPVAQPSNMGGSANSTPSSTQVPDQLRQSNQRIDGSLLIRIVLKAKHNKVDLARRLPAALLPRRWFPRRLQNCRPIRSFP